MMQGYGTVWPEMVSDLLAKREYGLEYTGLTDYYKFLDEYLDNQLEPSSELLETDDYDESALNEPIENEIPSSAENQETAPVSKEPENHEDVIDNVIDTGEESNSKFSVETSTVGVLEIKNPVAAGDQKEETPAKEASYNTYWWIGIAVALAVVVILVAIIARKRQNHRMQLERQRRDNSRA